VGRARVISGGADGLYTVRIMHDRVHIEYQILRLNLDLAEIAPAIEEAEDRLAVAELEVEEAWIEVNGLIDQQATDGTLPAADLSSMISLHNIERSKAGGLPALTGNGALHQAAQGHASWLAANDKTGHSGEGGSTSLQRAISAGYTGDEIKIGENVAAGVVPPSENVVRAWMGSSGHKANILGPFAHIGVGYACRNSGQHRHFWVVVFGSGGGGGAGSPSVPNSCEGESGSVPERIRQAMVLLAEVAAKRDLIALEQTHLLARQVTANSRLKALQAIPDDPVQEVWCADLTENIGGDPGTIEIPGEGIQHVILHPGYNNAAAHNEPRDGRMFHRAGMSPEQVYLAAALLPGWQRHLPTYRVGELTSVNQETDTGTVALDEVFSSAQSLPINAAATLTNIPIAYMDCNAAAFEVGDRVVVRFQGDWEAAAVIGFESHPRSCQEWPPIALPINSQTTQLISGNVYNQTAANITYDSTCDRFNVSVIDSLVYGGQLERKLFLIGTNTYHMQEIDGVKYERIVLGAVIWSRWDEEDRKWVEVDPPDTRLSMGQDPQSANTPFWTTDQEYGLIFRYDIEAHSGYDPVRPFHWRSLTYPPMMTVAFPDRNLSCSPARTAIDYNVVYGWSVIPSAPPRYPPGFAIADNPPFDAHATDGPRGLSYFAIEEDMPIRSTDGDEITQWLRDMGAPEEITVAQTADGNTYTKIYHLTGVELWPDASNALPSTRQRWCAIYKSTPPE